MIPSAHPGPEAATAQQANSAVEAARYALLRRLAPSMRHHLVVNLQPIGMIYEVMDRRLRAPQPDLADVHESAHKINGFARAALHSCLDVVTWLAPERNEVPPVPGEVRRCAVRNVLTAAMIHVTDENPPPADIVLNAEPTPAALVLALTLRPTQGDQGFSTEAGYRRLDWSDVEALAEAESVELKREGRQRLQLAIPWAKA
jgi:hypothetical protein